MAKPITPEQIAIVKSTAPVLKEHGNTITTVFYNNLLAAQPALKKIFSLTSQTTGRQPRALAGAVLAYASYIDDLPKLRTAIERIAHKHVSLQVSPPQYEVVGQFLIEAIGQVLGDAATPEIVDAWTNAYGVLAGVFIGREAQMYEANKAENWVGWRKFRIARKVAESDCITSFYLEPVDGVKPLPAYLPGQYVSLQVFVPDLGLLQSRQYSLSEAPRKNAEYYRVSVKKDEGELPGHPGLISNMLHNGYDVGDEVELSHPQGEFFVDPADKSKEGVPAVLISAGSGATALMSILGSLVPQAPRTTVPVVRPVSWIHGSRSSSSQPFANAVRDICHENEHVSANIFLSDVRSEDKAGVDYHFGRTRMDLGRLDAVKELYLSDKRSEYYICGPELFMSDIRAALMKLGVDLERIHIELFATGTL